MDKLTKDTYRVRFALPRNSQLGLRPGQHLILRGIIDDLEIQRAYTPISPANAEGYFEVLIKCYQTGLMSRYVESWRAGDTAFWRGPFGGFFYKPNQYGELLMLAAGTGLAPMVPILHSITDNADDETFITLVGCFKTFEGIYLKAFLQEQARFWNVRIFFVLSQMRKLTLRGEGTSPCRAARLGEARIWDLSLRLSDSRVPALTHCAVLPAIHPLASSIVWAGSLLVESVGWGQTSSGCVGSLRRDHVSGSPRSQCFTQCQARSRDSPQQQWVKHTGSKFTAFIRVLTTSLCPCMGGKLL
nr:NADH-cytochrome b5 reductase-like isoform X4 [Vicugna pacos]